MSQRSSDDTRSVGASRTTRGRWPLDWTAFLELTGIYVFLSVLGLALGSLAISWSEESPGEGLDESAVTWWHAQRSAMLDTLTNLGSSVADTTILGALVTVVFLALAFVWHRRRGATAVGLALGMEVAVFLTVSTTLDRGRPDIEQMDPAPPTASFPSGHVGASAAFALIVAVIVFWNTRNTIWRSLAVVGAIALPAIVALSRMYRGMHFVTDVVGGALLGAAAAIGAWIVITRAVARHGKQHSEELPA